MENSILFIHDLFNASLPIDYEKQGDRWIQFLSEELHKENKDINGHGIGGNTPSSEFPYHHWGFSAHVNPNDKTKTLAELKIVPVGEKSSKGVYLFLVARQELTLEEIDLWKKCIDTAIKRLNEDTPTFSWAAALVQSNSLFSINTQYVLKRKAILKSMNIRPGRKP